MRENSFGKIVKQVSSNIPTASRLSWTIFGVREYGAEDFAAQKELPFQISHMILYSMNTLAHYFERFEHTVAASKITPLQSYPCNRNVLKIDVHEDWK